MSNPVAFIFYSALALSALPCPAYARFGQENAVQGIIGSLGGGQAAALAGSSIGTLLAGSNACDKLTLADQVAALDSASAINAAKRLVQAERNFNPFAVDRPSICDDPNLPATQALRGILPLIDPAVPGADAVNVASAESLNTPRDQQGSQADLLREFGFDVFTPQGGAGGNVAAPEETTNEEPAKENIEAEGPSLDDCPASPVVTVDNAGSNGGAKNDLQTFSGSLGVAIEPIEFSGDTGRPFLVGGSTFVNFPAAADRSCDRQFNGCANVANSNSGADFSVSDCGVQRDQCKAAQDSAQVQSFSRRWVSRGRRTRTLRKF